MSEAVSLAPATADDCETLATWLSTPGINQWLGSQWRGETDPRRIAYAINSKTSRFYVASVPEGHAGLFAVSDIDRGDGLGMIWYLLGDQRLAGRGIMTRAVQQGVALAFTELPLESLYAWTHPGNAASVRILQKAGFQAAGRLRHAAVRDGQRVDRELWDLTKCKWRERGA